jgi:crossover junction endodeoxyribonuclease RusA
MIWRFAVYGVPIPKGSTRAFRVKGSERMVVTQANAKTLRPWEQAVRIAAMEAGITKIEGPVWIALSFFIGDRPRNQFNSKGHLKAWAPAYPPTRPDGDKLMRAVLDGLTGIAYRDDAQIVEGVWCKLYADHAAPGAVIVISDADIKMVNWRVGIDE